MYPHPRRCEPSSRDRARPYLQAPTPPPAKPTHPHTGARGTGTPTSTLRATPPRTRSTAHMTPTAPPARCSEDRCREYAYMKGKCEEHYKPWANRSKRNTDYSGYALSLWRKAVLARDPVCVKCRKKPAVEADHVIPVAEGGAGLDTGNGQGLCHRCHWYKTRQEIRRSNARRAGKPPPDEAARGP